MPRYKIEMVINSPIDNTPEIFKNDFIKDMSESVFNVTQEKIEKCKVTKLK